MSLISGSEVFAATAINMENGFHTLSRNGLFAFSETLDGDWFQDDWSAGILSEYDTGNGVVKASEGKYFAGIENSWDFRTTLSASFEVNAGDPVSFDAMTSIMYGNFPTIMNTSAWLEITHWEWIPGSSEETGDIDTWYEDEEPDGTWDYTSDLIPIFSSTNTSFDWTEFSTTASMGGWANLYFQAFNSGNGEFFAGIDNIQVGFDGEKGIAELSAAPVPVPPAGVLLVSAVAGLALRRRKTT